MRGSLQHSRPVPGSLSQDCTRHRPLYPQAARCRNRRRLHICNLFTGIVQGQAAVVDVEERENFRSIRIEFPDGKADGVQIGASVAVNGTCLTVTDIAGDVLSFDVIVETLRATNLGGLQIGSPINFERSARVGDEIGGHNVSGHIATTATVASIEETPDNRTITFKVPAKFVKYILPKGFIAVDGISLTVGEVGEDCFSVYLIPETLRVTTLGLRKEGDAVNIEIEAQTQTIVDTVERTVRAFMEQKGVQRAFA
ncbi:g7179 [Coccomyxa viridis]|uniref:G7179 protein n=1 Tax=Coccomyxa viridis TaxID=1274662 RepID=A0ABP1FX67_9CHLO